MNRYTKIIGTLLMLLGVLALVTPFTPGSWLIFIGAEMLGISMLSRANILKYYERVKRRWSGAPAEKKEE